MKNQFNSWVEISRSAIENNLKEIRKLIRSKTNLMAVIKSNAYGHSMIKMAKFLENKVDWFGVINLDEALDLRKTKIKSPILILSYWPSFAKASEGKPKNFNLICQGIKQNIDFPVYNLKQAEILSKIAKKLKKPALIHLKVDTGMSRLGVPPAEAIDFIKKLKEFPYLQIRGIFTHFAKAGSLDQNYVKWQNKQFEKILAQISQLKIKIPFIHAACSGAAILSPETHYNLVRVGVALYGLWPSQEFKNFCQNKINLKSVLSWKTKIISIKEIQEGTFVGYDCAFKAKRKTCLAVLPVGYWEGYDRGLSNKGEVLINGQRAKVIGRVCMNLIMVDVTDIKNVKLGDEVVLLGKQGKEEIPAEEIAEILKTISYEVVTRINPLITRIYL